MSGQTPAEFRSTTPERLRRHVQEEGNRLPAALRQRLQEAAAEIEGSEHAFADLVDQKQALQRALARTQTNLRAALANRAQR
ncbi:hypothetical protein [Burkholderia ubonensis]|uniref:hypothetical protein n=1 Tax=Burkholderia ubonensis TaxID=101571 RepID=UPI000758AC99|nr:hypothetical protein [Burkholderia ubonensis]AOI68734.1 hypothetical protein WI31_03645 [Burkholderia ubonensis]KUZ17415.1 hypothetical protein WI29_17975 [Burkholderia ubonensis]KUZ31191.1 hypothetical protein WI32_01000 [Burkholderia ubonensis]KUZ37963.1 hypothetical protein WI30_04760 [Burkholderia ubonensis]KUZ39963.1 hypothetical protein WI33_34475 [Burkholderia ubonensis]